ncbi:MAG: hypothetical protein QOJ87_2431 [Verrucomicrobiota bacterium]
MKSRRLKEILARARTKRLLVVGDLMLDEFVWGKVGRISPEAPVPVVQVTGESFYPGGAANVARNLREFTGKVAVVGLFGSDRGGRQLRDLLAEQKIDTANAIEDPAFPTIVKTRIIARNQQIVRVDREQLRSPSPAQVARVVGKLRSLVAKTDAVIFEDYGKGFLSADLVREISEQAFAAGKIVTADPNPHHPVEWKNLTAVKPNRNEAFLAAGLPWSDPGETPGNDKPLLRAGEILLEKWQTELVLITLGEQGMMLFERGR